MNLVAGLPVAQSVLLVVALRNPPEQYGTTRHNAGDWWLSKLAEGLDLTFVNKDKLHAQVSNPQQKIRYARTLCYMNESGVAVAAIASYFKIEPASILVVHDEIDLAVGDVRLKFAGGIAGHNGLRDVKRTLATDQFWRLRIGVGRPTAGSVSNFVLDKPENNEMQLIKQAIERSIQVWPQVISGELNEAMRLLHTE